MARYFVSYAFHNSYTGQGFGNVEVIHHRKIQDMSDIRKISETIEEYLNLKEKSVILLNYVLLTEETVQADDEMKEEMKSLVKNMEERLHALNEEMAGGITRSETMDEIKENLKQLDSLINRASAPSVKKR